MMLRTSLLTACLLLAGCNLGDRETSQTTAETKVPEKREGDVQQACASETTYDRLKELAFDEAARIRGDDAQALDRVADAAVVRMEDPVVQNRDEEANVTICSGRFVLELPPGSDNAFDGQRRITADIEYAAQNAEDGSGLVYQMEGAEPIIYRLATIGGLARAQAGIRAEPVAVPQASAPPGAPRQVIAAAPPPRQAAPQPQAQPARQAAPQTRPAPPSQARPAPRPQARPAPARVERAEAPPAPRAQPAARPARAEASARPSFNCRSARTRTERMVCSNGGLAAQDRRMASAYYAELANADAARRQRLRQTRDRFLARREQCRDAACVSSAYEQREAEIRAISGRE